MSKNDYTSRYQRVVCFGREEAIRLHCNYVELTHITLGLIRENDGEAIDLLKKENINLFDLRKRLEESIAQTNKTTTTPIDEDEVMLAEETNKIIKLSHLEAFNCEEKTVGTLHLLLAILHFKDTTTNRILHDMGLDYADIIKKVKQDNDSRSLSTSDYDEDEEDDDMEEEEFINHSSNETYPGNTVQKQDAKKKSSATNYLNQYSTDLTKAAQDGLLDPVIGRDKEIERIAQILIRRKKNNPILVGEAGVGKTAIVEGLAIRINSHNVPATLLGKRLVSLNLSTLVAGTKYRGQFEERIKNILAELREHPEIILFIDEIHQLVGAGSPSGTMDAANILKPTLARGELQCIGSTTYDEYKMSIEKDAALERRFQKIVVEAPTAEETYTILCNIKDRYERHHNVVYTDGAIKSCISLANRYITNRSFPDKAIDVLDEVGSKAQLTTHKIPEQVQEIEGEIEKLTKEKNAAVKKQNFELAASIRDQAQEKQDLLQSILYEWRENANSKSATITEEDVEQTVSAMTGVPVTRMVDTEMVQLRNMRQTLNKRVIAQETAVEKLVKAIQRNRLGLKDPNRPIGTFMFLGPTGVGKTLLAKELAKLMFGSADAIIRIDMSEYMEKFTSSRLVGAPPGYVGYENGGELTERVRKQPYSIILLDEIEKANKDIFNLLLQVMDEGRLTDSNGRLVDFRNTIIIMTSNVGSHQVMDFGKSIGFSTTPNNQDNKRNESIILKALQKQFTPEFLNRLDEVITFSQLDERAILSIINIELEKLTTRVAQLGFKLNVTDEAKQLLTRLGYNPQYGARPLRRSIQTHLEDELTELLINNKPQEGCTITAEKVSENDKLTLIVSE